MKTYMILGVKIDSLDIKAIFNLIQKAILSKKKIFLTTINSEFIIEAQRNSSFRIILNSSTVSIPDSTGVVWAVKKIYNKKIERQPGADLFLEICELCYRKRFRIFLLGGKEGVAIQAKNILQNKFKGLQIVGAIDGIKIDSSHKDINLINKINSSRPDLLFVALGAPKQEHWIAHNLLALNAKVYVGIGGTLDFISGRIRRAPIGWRKLGLEWLWRLFLQPSRFKRIFRAVVLFPYLIYKQKFIS